MSLDVLVATYNRSALLARTLESLLAAERPHGLEVRVTVVDNQSTDDTRALVQSFVPRFDGRLHYIYESRAGKSHALNAGIAATRHDLVGMIDDDEEVDRSWLSTVAAAFEDPTTDFIGGPYVPRWGAERPPWCGAANRAAIGWVDNGPRIEQDTPEFGGMLMGGNAVLRRSVLERVGAYTADLGRTSDGRLLSCEDRDMYNRLLAIGAKGFYRPDLVILHYVPPERLTKRYFAAGRSGTVSPWGCSTGDGASRCRICSECRATWSVSPSVRRSIRRGRFSDGGSLPRRSRPSSLGGISSGFSTASTSFAPDRGDGRRRPRTRDEWVEGRHCRGDRRGII